MKLAIILGTRPEIIKFSPIIRQCQKQKIDFFILHTNQHYDASLDEVFFRELDLPKAKYNLHVGSQESRGRQVGKMILGIEKVLAQEKPDVVLIQGDTNTVLAGALSASRLNIKIAHVEAGLRSYDFAMPEEMNRIMADNLADYLFPPTKESQKILIKEGFDKKNIFNVGNTVVDAVFENKKLDSVKNNLIGKNLKAVYKKYAILTLHRGANVDNPDVLKNIFSGLSKIDLPLIWPIHPRAKKNIENFKIITPDNIKIVDPPYAYQEFLSAMINTSLIFTDSGGVQEEACILKIPCITLRENTERPETLKVKSNILVGSDPQKIEKAFDKMIKVKKNWQNPFGDGKTAQRIISILKKHV